jgi:hypothetical protein
MDYLVSSGAPRVTISASAKQANPKQTIRARQGSGSGRTKPAMTNRTKAKTSRIKESI